jgi:uncharacterized damage-inducible protein DinB
VNIGRLLRIQARANRLANFRLHEAMAGLSSAELQAPRIGFFPSLMATLNHILGVDGYYIAALTGRPDAARHWDSFVPAASLTELAARQSGSDTRLIAYCDGEDNFEREVQMPRGAGRIQRDAAAFVLQHLFAHQVHHRGQLHSMLSGTAVAPPQLDEFIMPSEAHLRSTEMAALGWDEAQTYGPGPYN